MSKNIIIFFPLVCGGGTVWFGGKSTVFEGDERVKEVLVVLFVSSLSRKKIADDMQLYDP